MTFRTMLFIFRKPTISFDEFQHLYETSHVALVKSLSGDLYPLSQTRRYMAEKDRPATAPFDAVVEMTFEDRDAWNAFSANLMDGENGAKVVADCEQFLDTTRTAMVEVGDVKETRRQDPV